MVSIFDDERFERTKERPSHARIAQMCCIFNLCYLIKTVMIQLWQRPITCVCVCVHFVSGATGNGNCGYTSHTATDVCECIIYACRLLNMYYDLLWKMHAIRRRKNESTRSLITLTIWYKSLRARMRSPHSFARWALIVDAYLWGPLPILLWCAGTVHANEIINNEKHVHDAEPYHD